MTLVTHPLSIAGCLHMTDQFQKKTLCGVWLHPTFWRKSRPTIATVCQICKAQTPTPSEE